MLNKRYLLLGCELTAGNLGVAALGCSLVRWLHDSQPSCEISIQNAGRIDSCETETADGTTRVRCVPLHYSRSLRARYGTRRVEVLHACGRIAPAPIRSWAFARNPAIEAITKADVVIDVSAGDSFTELYGARSFEHQCGIKETVLGLGRPLVLAPQTIGPFKTTAGRDRARRILEQCILVATRDVFGLRELRELMGSSFDDRFVSCPDLAFGLVPEREEPTKPVDSDRDTVGINVSELLQYNYDEFGIKSDYPLLMKSLIKMFLDQTSASILLVPHVFPHLIKDKPRGRSSEERWARSDVEACEEVANQFAASAASRVRVLRDCSTAPRVKRAIGRCDFFVGARMHACIAAVSQSVPTATLAYSKKVAGVMGMLGIPETAVDLRSSSHDQAVEAVRRLYLERERLRETLDERVPLVKAQLSKFFREVLPGAIQCSRSCKGTARRA